MAAVALTAAIWCTAGCASSPDAVGPVKTVVADEFEVRDEPMTTGFLVTDLGNRVAGWNKAKLDAKNQRDYQVADSLRQDVKRLVNKNFELLLEELEVGPPSQRSVIASALGFSESPAALGPLIQALDDSDPLVVGNALVGLGMLKQADTPLDQICYQLRTSEDPYNRNNAAYCLQRLVDAGAEGDCALQSARLGLEDRQPGVRLSCAWILGRLGDAESLDALGKLLKDPEARVAQAAAMSLRSIGQNNDESKGGAARLLLSAVAERKGALREAVRQELARLRGTDLGKNTEDWRRWAYSLP